MTKQKATPTAIAVAAITTLDVTVNSFVAELTAAQQTQVRESVQMIKTAQMAMVKARIVVGEALAKLHQALGKESFDKFLGVVGNKLGLSRTSAYRFFGAYKMVHGQLGQAADHVLALTDGGNQITTTDQKSGSPVFTREAKVVMEKMKKDAPLPSNPSEEQKEQWARTFTKLVNAESRSTSKGKSPLDIVEERISAIWERFGDIIERVNKLKGAKERKEALDTLRDTIEAMSTEHAKLAKTISAVPAVAATAKAPKVKTPKVPEPTSTAVHAAA